MAVRLAVDKRDFDGALQLCIESDDGCGLRLAGPKYDGRGKRLLTCNLTREKADEIRQYLDQVK